MKSSDNTAQWQAAIAAVGAKQIATNQIELHPYNEQTKTIAASRKAGLSVTAYSPIARGKVKSDAKGKLNTPRPRFDDLLPSRRVR